MKIRSEADLQRLRDKGIALFPEAVSQYRAERHGLVTPQPVVLATVDAVCGFDISNTPPPPIAVATKEQTKAILAKRWERS